MRTTQKIKEQDTILNLKNQLKNNGLNRLQKSEILNNIGSQYYNQTQYKKSIEYYLQVLRLLPGEKQLNTQEQEQKLIAYRYISENYRKLHKYKKGLEYCENHQELSELFKNELEIQRSYCSFGQIYMDQAEYCLEKNRCISENFEKTIDLSIGYFVKSQTQIKKLIDANAKKNYNALNTQNNFSLYDLKQKYAESLLNQAGALFVKGKWDSIYYDESINKLKETLKEADQIQDAIIKGKCYNTLGLIYLQKKEYEKAIKQFIKDADICRQQNDVSGLIDDYMNLGIVNQCLIKYEEAQTYYKKALNLSKENQFDQKKQELNEKLDDLKKEEELRKECAEIEKKLKRETNSSRNENYQQKQMEYIDILLNLEEYQKIIDYTSSVLQRDQNNIKMLVNKAIAEEKLKKFLESKISYEKAILFYRKVDKQTADYANCLIEYANVLDELKSQVDLIVQNYQEAYQIALKLEDIYIQKVVLENLDILYEAKKMKKQRIQNKKLIHKLIKQHPELKEEDQSQSQDSSDSESLDCNQDEDNDNDEIILSQKNVYRNNSIKMKNSSTQRQMEKPNQKINKSNENKQYNEMEVEDDYENQNISLRKKKNFSKILEDVSDGIYSEEEDISKQQEELKNSQTNIKINKNFFKQGNSSEDKINKNQGKQYQLDQNSSSIKNSNNQVGTNHKFDNIKQDILERYNKKCQKYFVSKDDNILKILEQTNDLNLKKQYYTDIKLSPFFKTIRNIENLQILDLSYNLLTNISLKQLNFSKYNKNLTKLNLAYNFFFYDEKFNQILYQCQDLQNLTSLNISGLRIQPSYYEQIWNQIIEIKTLKIFKFKNSELNGIPKFLQSKLEQSQIEALILKNNNIDPESMDSLTLTEQFREGFKLFF
ncbi:tetratricopeptide repeat protein (macronuclear) [Tetrahymena thermophila SB210]|uniref:Tetratricopeptide repeat protein n=1 Tax=Tetrahymena thermophila (strain SB210) TaxID=312017 RepID=I7MIR1_TETTS|nr:tetratricopeptide repeat protein [Tetrahymena thermophila SB210]EAR94173.2 tetratricopeptide repeat protein [Tetrahymena thermophila SB210]|eukprot:XP_001014418.2 tetratricopeptide repeat protein [Tetrahymena thermophila SB210]